MDLSQLPITSLARVWHVGSLQASDKWCHGTSLEGAGLSVSLHPHAWIAIAKLGGQPVWAMHRQDKALGRFLDFHAMRQDHREQLAQTGVARGWVVQQPRFRVDWVDPETEDARYCLFEHEGQALAEAADMGQWAEDVKQSQVLVHVATPALCEHVGQRIDDGLALDMVATSLVEECDSLDGVWWHDTLDEAALSAPRGVLSRRALPLWTSRQR
ncbi:hypothetical protein D3C71_25450 [compost metagenome]